MDVAEHLVVTLRAVHSRVERFNGRDTGQNDDPEPHPKFPLSEKIGAVCPTHSATAKALEADRCNPLANFVQVKPSGEVARRESDGARLARFG